MDLGDTSLDELRGLKSSSSPKPILPPIVNNNSPRGPQIAVNDSSPVGPPKRSNSAITAQKLSNASGGKAKLFDLLDWEENDSTAVNPKVSTTTTTPVISPITPPSKSSNPKIGLPQANKTPTRVTVQGSDDVFSFQETSPPNKVSPQTPQGNWVNNFTIPQAPVQSSTPPTSRGSGDLFAQPGTPTSTQSSPYNIQNGYPATIPTAVAPPYGSGSFSPPGVPYTGLTYLQQQQLQQQIQQQQQMQQLQQQMQNIKVYQQQQPLLQPQLQPQLQSQLQPQTNQQQKSTSSPKQQTPQAQNEIKKDPFADLYKSK